MFKFKEEECAYYYKYLPFDEGSLKVITEGTIKFSCPLDFNDPFDCLPCFDMDSIEGLRLSRYSDLGKQIQQIKPATRIQNRSKWKQSLRNQVQSGDFFRGLQSEMGVLCLSKNPLNTLMWSHYADFHRGFVVEFRIPFYSRDMVVRIQAARGERIIPHPITYSSTRPTVGINIKDKHQLSEDLLFTKSEQWRYEEEHRAVVPDRGPGIYPYERDEILTGVIGGMKMNEENFRRLQQAVDMLNQRGLSIGCYKATASDSDYSLLVHGHPRLSRVAPAPARA